MIICECGRIHSNYHGKRGKATNEAIGVIAKMKGEFQASEAMEKIDLPAVRVNSLIAQMRKAGYIEVAGATLNSAGTRACLTYKVVAKFANNGK